MATTYDGIINLAGAGNGASGTTGMAGATRARVIAPSVDVKRMRAANDLMPRKVVAAGVSQIRVEVETESPADYLTALADIDANTIHALSLNYVTTNASPSRKFVAKFAKVVAAGDCTMPPREGSGNFPRWMITYELEQGSGVTKLSEAVVDSSGHATLA